MTNINTERYPTQTQNSPIPILNPHLKSNDQLILDDALQTSSLIDQDTKQKIILQGNDSSNTYNLYSNDCQIYASKNSSESRINASNKIKVNRLVNYEWEQRYNNGNLIAVHKSGLYFAYSIRMENNGKVRIFHKKLNEKVLLKSFKGRVVDLSFAHFDSQVLLGCVDETGCLQIFKITLDNDSKIQTSLIFHLLGLSPKPNPPLSNGSVDTTTHRIIWCLYIPEPCNTETDTPTSMVDDASKVFVLTRKNRADIFHLDLLEQNYDCSNPLDANDLTIGHLVVNDNKSTILTASFSPDGSAFATSSSNGEVDFFKISFTNNETNNSVDDENDQVEDADENETLRNQLEDEINNKTNGENNVKKLKHPMSPKCLKIWKPHDNKPVNSLYFLDDHKNSQADAQFWSFILTGTDYNREIKIWSCLKWICLQTIQFCPSPLDDALLSSPSKTSQHNQQPCFKTSIDLTSKYLVMSDITRKCFYVLHLYQDFDSCAARCTAISEYILAYPALSFAIIDSQQIKAKKYNQLNNLTSGNISQQTPNLTDDLNTLNEANNLSLNCTNDLINTSLSSLQTSSQTPSAVPQLTNEQDHLVTMIRLYCIQTKQLQEMQIFLTGDQTISSFNNNSASPPPPPSLIPLSSSVSSTSLLQQLLPNQTQRKSLQNSNRLSQSISLSSDIKSRLSDSHTSDYEQPLENTKLTEDSAIVQIVTPPIAVNTLTAPILMTPDAFINSPNTRKSSEPAQQKLDILQSFLNNSINSNNSNMSQSVNNLLSSRTSSLTQVTQVNQEPLTKLSTNGVAQKNMQKRRTLTSSSSSTTSSSSSSSCSSSTCSSSGSDMDQADKEIAALSTNTKSLKLRTKIKNTRIRQEARDEQVINNVSQTTELLLNQVSIEEDVTTSKLNTEEVIKVDEQVKSNWPNPPLAETDDTSIKASNQAQTNDFDLKNLLIQMTQAIRTQNEEIESLKKQQINSQAQLKTHLDLTLKQAFNNTQQQNSVLNTTDEQKLGLVMQQALNSSLIPKLDKLIREEVGKSIQTQLAQKLLDPLREQLSRDLAEKFKSIENVLKDNVSKLFKSKTTIDTMSQSISNSMQGVIVNSYRETFQKLIVPNFEKSCQNMYQQVNSSFAKGTQDYLSEFDQLAKQQKKMFDDNKEPVLAQLKLYTEQMQAHGKQVANEMATNLQQQFDNHLRSTNAILQDTIISSVKAIIKEEIQIAMKDQQHVLPDRLITHMRQSGTLTPVNLPGHGAGGLMGPQHHSQTSSAQDIKTQIHSFLQKGQLNSAFQVALCAADLSMLMNLCEMVNPSQVFEVTVNNVTKKQQCQLQQPVILSLIQQLSQDLNTNTELKVKYLEEALMNLDLGNALTREHTPSVMNQLIMKLQQYIQVHPNEKSTRSLKMLLMASQSLLSQPVKQAKGGSIPHQSQLNVQHHDTF